MGGEVSDIRNYEIRVRKFIGVQERITERMKGADLKLLHVSYMEFVAI